MRSRRVEGISTPGEVHHTSDKQVPHGIPFSDRDFDDGAIHSDDQNITQINFPK
jgi:hypothetical protein